MLYFGRIEVSEGTDDNKRGRIKRVQYLPLLLFFK